MIKPRHEMAALEVAFGAQLALLGEGVEDHGVGLRRRLLPLARAQRRVSTEKFATGPNVTLRRVLIGRLRDFNSMTKVG